MPKTTLTTKEQRFVEEFLIDFNGTDAMRRAGYTGKSDNVLATHAYKLIRKHQIAQALKERIQKLTEHADDLTKNIISEAMRLAFSDVRKLFDADGKLKSVHQLDDDTAASISAIEVTTIGELKAVTKIKLWDKNAALDKLFRYMALYKDPGHKDNPFTTYNVDPRKLPIEDLIRIRDNPQLIADYRSN